MRTRSEMSSWTMSRSISSSVCTASTPATIAPPDAPETTDGSCPASISALTTPM